MYSLLIEITQLILYLFFTLLLQCISNVLFNNTVFFVQTKLSIELILFIQN